MEAKDTVMSSEEIERCLDKWNDVDNAAMAYGTNRSDVKNMIVDFLQVQAEIAFKAGMQQGIWLFAWWKDDVQYVGTSGRTLKEAYKELGLDSTTSLIV